MGARCWVAQQATSARCDHSFVQCWTLRSWCECGAGSISECVFSFAAVHARMHSLFSPRSPSLPPSLPPKIMQRALLQLAAAFTERSGAYMAIRLPSVASAGLACHDPTFPRVRASYVCGARVFRGCGGAAPLEVESRLDMTRSFPLALFTS